LTICADTLSDVASAMLSLPTLAHPLSNADESPATKQTRHAMIRPTHDDSRIVLPSWAERRQSMTLGGCQWMIADNCCRKSSNRQLVAVVATGETVGVGQTEKNSVRAYVFRFAPQTRTLLDAFLAGTTSRVMRSGRDQVVGCCGFFRHPFVAEHAGFFARLFGRKAPQQDQQRLGASPASPR
jgi:hypothetical protein